MTFQSKPTEQEQAVGINRTVRARSPSKKRQLIKLLSRKSGADMAFMSEKFGWQPHTTRAALSGLRKAGFVVTKENAGSSKPTRYRIMVAQEAVATAENPDGQ